MSLRGRFGAGHPPSCILSPLFERVGVVGVVFQLRRPTGRTVSGGDSRTLAVVVWLRSVDVRLALVRHGADESNVERSSSGSFCSVFSSCSFCSSSCSSSLSLKDTLKLPFWPSAFWAKYAAAFLKSNLLPVVKSGVVEDDAVDDDAVGEEVGVGLGANSHVSACGSCGGHEHVRFTLSYSTSSRRAVHFTHFSAERVWCFLPIQGCRGTDCRRACCPICSHAPLPE